MVILSSSIKGKLVFMGFTYTVIWDRCMRLIAYGFFVFKLKQKLHYNQGKTLLRIINGLSCHVFMLYYKVYSHNRHSSR